MSPMREAEVAWKVVKSLCVTRVKDYKEFKKWQHRRTRAKHRGFHFNHAWGLCFAHSWQDKAKGISKNINSAGGRKVFHKQ